MSETRSASCTFFARSGGGFDVKIHGHSAQTVYEVRELLRGHNGLQFPDDGVRCHDGSECYCVGYFQPQEGVVP